MGTDWQGSVFVERSSASVIEGIFKLHFPDAVDVIDLTYGPGRFWDWSHSFHVVGFDVGGVKAPPPEAPRVAYDYVDSRTLSALEAAFDVAVIDPPFILRGKDGPTTSALALQQDYGTLPSLDDVLGLYASLIRAAKRLAPAIVVKGKDVISSGSYVSVSSVVEMELLHQGYELVDKAVYVPPYQMPLDPKWRNQQHFRRGESYFWVARQAA